MGWGIRRYVGRRGTAPQILGELLIRQQLAAGHSHQLDAHAHEAYVVDVGCDVRAGSGETHPRRIGARLREDAATHTLRKVIADDDLATHDAVRLGVSSALAISWFPHTSPLLAP